MWVAFMSSSFLVEAPQLIASPLRQVDGDVMATDPKNCPQ
jgi:hypothetical protein